MRRLSPSIVAATVAALLVFGGGCSDTVANDDWRYEDDRAGETPSSSSEPDAGSTAPDGGGDSRVGPDADAGDDSGGSSADGGSCSDPRKWYRDRDGDGVGSRDSVVASCRQPSGFAAEAGDCDETDPSVHPGAEEACNRVDDDCDGKTDEAVVKNCPKREGVCAGTTVQCRDGSFPSCDASDYGPEYETNETSCDARDNDCDGTVDPASIDCTKGATEWTRMIGTTKRDRASTVDTDSRGRAVVGGDMGTGNGKDAWVDGLFLRKFTLSGDVLWTTAVGEETASIDDVAVDAGGDVYAVGTTHDPFGGNQLNGGTDAWVAKFDSSGTREWVEFLGSPKYDGAKGVAVDANGDLYVAGYMAAAVAGQSYGGGETDAFLARYAANGTRKWVRLSGVSDRDNAEDVAVRGGAVYLAGHAFVDPASNKYDDANYDARLVRYDPAGNRIWQKTFGTGDADRPRGVAVAVDGTVYIGGGIGERWSSADDRGFVAAFDPSGTRQWFDEKPGLFSFINAIDTDGRGGFYAAGPILSNSRVVKFSRRGNHVWSEGISASDHDPAMGVAAGPGKQVYAVGMTKQALNGRSFIGDVFDGWIVKIE